MCRKAFLVNADLALRAQLTEFRDHKLIRFELPISLICRAVLFLLFLFSVLLLTFCVKFKLLEKPSIFPVSDTQQLEVITSRAHFAT